MNEPTDREILLELRGDVKDIRRQTTLTNGRVTRLEGWQREVEIRDAEARGRATAGAVVTKAQLALFGSVIGVIGTVAGVIGRYWP